MIRIATLDDETQWLTTERIITEQCFESGDYSFSAYNDVDKFLLELKYKENDLYLLDMEFPSENGISAYSVRAKRVHTRQFLPQIALAECLFSAYNENEKK